MTNTNNIVIERNKQLLAKIEELENKEKTEISREAQLKIIDKIEQWKKENYETGDRLKKYENNTYPSHIVDNITEDRPLFKSLAGHVNFELMMVQYLHKKENPLDELLEMMLDKIMKNVVGYYNENGLREKERKEWQEKVDKYKGKIERLIKETFPYDKLEEKPLKWNERIGGVERGYLDTINGIDYSDCVISYYKEREEDLKEKEILIKDLEVELEETKEGRQVNLDAIKLQENWEINKRKDLEIELENEKETRQDFVQKLAEEIVENRKLTEKWNEEHEKVKEEISKNLEKDEVIRKLKEEIYLANLPKTTKFKILKEKSKTKFQHLLKKVKHQSRELIARIEVKTK